MSTRRATILTTLALVAAGFLAAPGLRWIVAREIQLALNIRFRAQSSSVEYQSGVVQLQDVDVDVPLSEGLHKFNVESATFQLKNRPLLNRRVEIDRAVLRGIQFPKYESKLTSVCQRIDDVATEPHDMDWFPTSILGGTGDQIYREFGDGLLFEGAAKELEEQWMAQFQSIEADRMAIESRVQQLQGMTAISSNPLREIDRLQKAVAESNMIKDELNRLQTRIDSVNVTVQRDRRQLEEIQRNDFQVLTGRFSKGALDAEEISRSIQIELCRQLLGRIEQQSWMGTSPLELFQRSSISRSTRGKDFLFEGDGTAPQFQVRKAQWDGQGEIGDQRYEVRGKLQGMASDGQANWPMQLVSAIRSGEQLFHCTANRTASISGPADWLEVTTDNMGFSDWTLTNQQGLKIVCHGKPIKATYRKATIESLPRIELELQQEEVAFSLESLESPSSERIARTFNRSMSSITSWSIQATIQGSVESDADWQMTSSLSESLEASLQEAVKAEIAMSNVPMLKRLQDDATTRLQALEIKVAMKTQEAKARVATLRNGVQQALAENGPRNQLRGGLRMAIPIQPDRLTR